MNIQITPSKLMGTITAISSKSDIHRLLICGALADKTTTISLFGSMNANNLSNDINATINCLNALGADIRPTKDGTGIKVVPIIKPVEDAVLDCKESGSTLRFLLPVVAALGVSATFTGSGLLPTRPIEDLLLTLENGGIKYSNNVLPLISRGKLRSGTYSISGDISSQYITGLLLGLSKVSGESRIKLTSKLESSSYVDMTTAALKKFSVNIEVRGNEYIIPAEKELKTLGTLSADGDWSNSSYFLLLHALNQDVKVLGLSPLSPQGDKQISPLLAQMTQTAPQGNDFLSSPNFLTISIAEYPDLLPTLAIAAVYTPTGAKFTDAHRLHSKESDRLHSIASMINNLGGRAAEGKDTLIVFPKELEFGTVNSFNDHRIVMAATIAATMCKEPIKIIGAEAVNKSYPTFFEDIRSLGGKIDVI